MKILIFNWRDIKNPISGGAEVFTHEIFKRIAKKGNEVTLFTSEFPNCEKEEIIDGIKIIRAGGRYWRYSVYWKAKEYYKKYFSKEGFDIIVDECNTRPFLIRKYVNSGEKIILLIHQLAREYWFYETSFPINLIGYYYLEKKWLRNYLNIPTITVSDSTKQDLFDLGFKIVDIVYNGINVKPLNNPPLKNKNPSILFVGRMIKAKKPQEVLKAFEIVNENINDSELWIVGDGYLRKKLEKKAHNKVKIFGYVDEKRKNELMKKAWVIAVPGVREGWGQVVTDASALGTPVIGYNVHGLRDSIKNEFNGLLIKSDYKVLAKTLIKVLEDKKLREKLSKNALQYAKKFSWDKSAEKFEIMLKNVIK